MPQVVPSGFAAVVHSMLLSGDPEAMAITYGIGFEDPFDISLAQAVTNSLRSAFTNSLGGIIATGYSHQNTEMTLGDVGVGEFVFVDPTPVVFTGTTNPLPQNSALLVHKRTGTTGRRNRGRCYIPGVNEVEVAPNGIISAALLAAWNTALANWLTAIQNITGVDSMFILHTQLPLAPPVPVPTRVNLLQADPVIATQRRRLR